MDVNTLMKIVLSDNSVGAISKSIGVSEKQVSGVVSSLMPLLLQGAAAQATGAATANSFSQALDQHGKADTSDLGSFLSKVDLADGAKIVQHLLGGSTNSSVAATAAQSGVSEANVKKILTMVAPLLLAILGQQKKKHGLGSLLLKAVMTGAVGKVGGSDMLSILGKLLK